MISIFLILIPALPLASAVLTAMLGPKLLRQRAHWPTLIALGGSFLMSLMLLLEVNHQLPKSSDSTAQKSGSPVGWYETVTLWTWLDVDDALPTSGCSCSR